MFLVLSSGQKLFFSNETLRHLRGMSSNKPGADPQSSQSLSETDLVLDASVTLRWLFMLVSLRHIILHTMTNL